MSEEISRLKDEVKRRVGEALEPFLRCQLDKATIHAMGQAARAALMRMVMEGGHQLLNELNPTFDVQTVTWADSPRLRKPPGAHVSLRWDPATPRAKAFLEGDPASLWMP